MGLTRSTSAAVLHHPNVLNISSLASLKTKVKLTYLASVEAICSGYLASVVVSQDPFIAVLHHPNVLNVPSLTLVKLTYLASVVVSQDTLIEENAGLSLLWN